MQHLPHLHPISSQLNGQAHPTGYFEGLLAGTVQGLVDPNPPTNLLANSDEGKLASNLAVVLKQTYSEMCPFLEVFHYIKSY